MRPALEKSLQGRILLDSVLYLKISYTTSYTVSMNAYYNVVRLSHGSVHLPDARCFAHRHRPNPIPTSSGLLP